MQEPSPLAINDAVRFRNSTTRGQVRTELALELALCSLAHF